MSISVPMSQNFARATSLGTFSYPPEIGISFLFPHFNL